MEKKLQLPDYLVKSIESFCEKIPLKNLKEASVRLSNNYLAGFVNKRLQAPLDHIAYLATRFPATFAACSSVFHQIKLKTDKSFETLLDLGSGPGTVVFAALEYFPSLKKIYIVEQDAFFIEFCKKTLRDHFPYVSLEVLANDIKKTELKEVDLITSSYALNELGEKEFNEIAERVFSIQKDLAVFIEPGTPRGYSLILKLREMAFSKNKFPLAPCPHSLECPLAKTQKWCHFSERLPRSSIHRFLKEARLNFEDEKFSYFAASNIEITPLLDRIIGHPRKHSGHISFDLCTKEGKATQEIISKRDGAFYKEAKELKWGDCLER